MKWKIPHLPVKVIRHAAGFTQVYFYEKDREIDPQYITYSITGWVPDVVLTSLRIHHSYLFSAPNATPARWTISVDYTLVELFWVPVNELPSIVFPQDRWIKWLPVLD